MNKKLLFSLLLAGTAFTGHADEARLLRFPATNGSDIVFSYAGDLYKAPLNGGEAQKLTSHIGYEMFARFSPDGKSIAFTGQYDGNTEVYLIPTDGGEPQRLTYTATNSRDDLGDRMGPNNIVMTWTPDGKNIVYRNRISDGFDGKLWSISKNGGMSEVIPLPEGGFCSYSPDGKKLAYNRVMREFRNWKYYRGGMADDIWIYDPAAKKVENITNNIAQDIIPMWIGEEIYFISDRDRTMNIFVYNIRTKQTEKVTHYTDYDVKFPSSNGQIIVYEHGGYLYKLDPKTRKSEKISITLTSDNIYARKEMKRVADNLTAASLSPDGHRLAVTARGEVFDVPAEKGVTRDITRTPGANEREGEWSPNGKQIAYISDRTGETEIWLQSVEGGDPIQLTQNNDTYIRQLMWSPDSKKILYTDRKNRIVEVDIASKAKRTVMQNPEGEFYEVNYSPDSQWITYTKSGANNMSVIYVYHLTSGKEYPVTEKWYNSSSPVFSTDGKYLIFNSERDFNPIYSQTEWNHAYNRMGGVYMAMLANDTPSPLLPSDEMVSIEQQATDAVNKKTEATNNAVKIDPEGLPGRLIKLPLQAGNYDNFYSDVSLADKIQFSSVVTDVKIENKSIFFAEDESLHTINRISLAPNSRNIEIFFSSLIYSLNSKVEMAYKLDGVDKDWVYLPYDKNSAFYNQLKKGTYSFWLKWKYGQGKWTEGKVVLVIVQAPAFYETWLAYMVYLVLIVLAVYLSFHTYAQRIKIKNEVKLKEELARTKLNYFTNISHELLTPLTVISCITDHLEQKVPAIRQQSVILKSNADKLKRLIQQILDFRKMDVGKMNLNVSEGNISEFIQNICKTNFLPLAQKKGIILEIDVEPLEIKGYLDFDKLDKIIYNLLSNAIKYTPEYKCIKVNVYLINKEGNKVLVIKIKDEGIGISPKEINYIFTRFYSSKKRVGIESNGIGLSLTKELVNLHHGTITVDSELGKGTCFTVELPIDRMGYKHDEIVDEMEGVTMDITECAIVAEDDVSSDGATDKSTLLLIDDNAELLYIMKEMFKEKYSVWTAADGQQAWDKLSNHEVDMIICDVMLPDINGWELCTRIKSDLRFNHIPVIILTAKNGIDDRIASYDAGADGYIAKPFEMKVLFARVDNLIRSFKMRQAAFRKEEDVNLETLAYPSANKLFLQSIIASIEQHLEESEFDLERLSVEMNMSKSSYIVK